jgi:hypothetical protein
LTVCVIAVVMVLVWSGGGRRRGAVVVESVAPSPSPRPYRGALQLTVDLPNHGVLTPNGLYKMSEGSDGAVQFMRVSSNTPTLTASVAVFDPGAFDPTDLLRGERITVAGHPAYRVPDLVVGTDVRPVRQAAIGWQDASGAWVVVYSAVLPEGLPVVAEAVLLGPPREVSAPFRLSQPPAGLRYEYLHLAGPPGPTVIVSVGFGDDNGSGLPRRQLIDVGRPERTRLPLVVRAFGFDESMDGRVRSLQRAPVPIAGHDTWYVATTTRVWTVPAGGASLVVRIGNCYYSFDTYDKNRMPYEAVKRVVEGTQFADCTSTSRSTWFPVP